MHAVAGIDIKSERHSAMRMVFIGSFELVIGNGFSKAARGTFGLSMVTVGGLPLCLSARKHHHLRVRLGRRGTGSGSAPVVGASEQLVRPLQVEADGADDPLRSAAVPRK
jgi:hypothetical protein